MTSEQHAEILQLRSVGTSYSDIEEQVFGIRGNGTKAWRVCKGTTAANGAERPSLTREISLWKAVDGGLAFRRVEALLEAHGIPCDKGEKSPFEGHYNILIREEDAAKAEALLFVELEMGMAVQAVDVLSDPTA